MDIVEIEIQEVFIPEILEIPAPIVVPPAIHVEQGFSNY